MQNDELLGYRRRLDRIDEQLSWYTWTMEFELRVAWQKSLTDAERRIHRTVSDHIDAGGERDDLPDELLKQHHALDEDWVRYSAEYGLVEDPEPDRE